MISIPLIQPEKNRLAECYPWPGLDFQANSKPCLDRSLKHFLRYMQDRLNHQKGGIRFHQLFYTFQKKALIRDFVNHPEGKDEIPLLGNAESILTAQVN